MKSILKELEENFHLIMETNGDELTKEMVFSEDINYAFEALLQAVNKAYVNNINPKRPIRVFLKKTHTGRCYIKVIGRDRNTKLIIRSEASKKHEFYYIEGYKITEKELAQSLDLIQRKKLEKSGIAKRFIKEIIPEVDLYDEMGIESFITDCKEINMRKNQPISVELYDEPENNIGVKRVKQNENTAPIRMNPVIPYEIRKRELIKYHQKEIIRFRGKKTSNLFDAYIYIKNGFVLAIVEPLSGIGYQYNLNLGFVEDYNEDRIKEMIKAALEAKENLVMEDDAMMRKNHTTLESFANNIEVFLLNVETDKRFASQVQNATQVYQKIRKK